jgi:methionyl-tRNA formyltransferase
MRNELTVQPQDDSLATFAPIMNKEDGAIDWNQTAHEISTRVRGFQPFPTSYTKYQEKKLTVWKSHELQGSNFKFQNSGEILEAKTDKLFIACGNQTVLQIDELQLEGKKRMTVRDFLNGVKINVGEKLG